MLGQTISQYKVLEKLGEGGMGIVYKAEDTNLQRFVAIKFLPPDLTRDQQANERFINEARAASALDHPNVGTIYEVDRTEDGQMFIVMAFYEGETLKDRIKRGPVSVDEAMDIAQQIANGLSRAHESNIIHRDIKPANIIVTDRGEVKILDFGLAKLAGQTHLTKTGMTLGTAAYMSPEQTVGQEVDHRTDIWSLGVVLYEMLTGEPPFKGEFQQAVLYSIMNEEPEPVSINSSNVPVALEGIVDKALAKTKEVRYASAEELLDALEQVAVQTSGGMAALVWSRLRKKRIFRRPIFYVTLTIVLAAIATLSFRDQLFPEEPIRIAVLPFEAGAMSEEKEAQIAGLWYETLNDFLKLERIRPLTRDIAKRYNGNDYDPGEIRKRYAQDFALRTLAKRVGDEFRFTAYMTDLRDFGEVWQQEFVSGHLNFKNEYMSRIFKALGLRLEEHEHQYLRAPTQNSRAYSYYLRGSSAIGTNMDLDLAITLFGKAIEIDQKFGLAHAGMALALALYLDLGFTSDVALRNQAENEASLAVQYDPNSGEAHAQLGFVYLTQGRIQDAYQQSKKAIELEANNLMARIVLINVYQDLGLVDRALALCQESVKIDPLFTATRFKLGNVLIRRGDVEEGLKIHEETLELYPNNHHILILKGWGNMLLGRFSMARLSLEQAQKVAPQNLFVRLVETLLLAAEGNSEQARASLTPELLEYAKIDAVRARWTAQIYAQLNDIDTAIYWLQRRIDLGQEGYPQLLKDPLIDNMRGDLRFQEIMIDLKTRWERYKKEIK